MKTAMQELMQWMEKTEFMVNVEFIDKVNECLEKEKEQIKDAWDAGMSEGIGTMMADLDWDGEFVNYYKETYGE
jgi:ferritin